VAVDFPNAPAPGEVFGIYTWDGEKWVATTAAVTTAAGVPYTPTGGVQSNNVQNAISELDTEKVAKAGDVMSGMLEINQGAASSLRLHYNSSAAANGQLAFFRTGLQRWQVLAGGPSETGAGNVGSDFIITRSNDAGVAIDQPITIKRADGKVQLNGDPTAALHAATKQYVDGRGTIAQGDTPPATPNASTLWFDTVGGQLYVYMGSVWVAANSG
jgi:hypothetical protein